MATVDSEGVFELEKGDMFQIDKALTAIHVGTYWEPATNGPAHDLDSHAVLLIHRGDDPSNAVMYGGGSHFLTYANKTLVPDIGEDGDVEGFKTVDGSMWHSPDNRRGGDAGGDHGKHDDAHKEELSEEMITHLSQLPAKGAEVAVWLTIHKAAERQLDFSKINGLFIEICDLAGNELCRYHPKGEFAGFAALQVGSLMKQPDGSWVFEAIGAGSKTGLGDIIKAYQG